MKGYKGMKSDMTCRGMQFEIGKTYHVDGNIELCSNGLHFCQRLVDVFDYYNDDNDRYFEVETDTEVKTDTSTSELTVLKDASVVRRWTNGKGIGGIAKEANKDEYTLDEIGDVTIRNGKILFEIPCEW